MPWVLPCLVFALGAPGESASQPERLTRVYDIRFLTEYLPEFSMDGRWPSAGEFILPELNLHPRNKFAAAGSGVALSAAEDPTVTPGVRVDPETLVHLIKNNIATDSWANERNSLSAGDHQLVVVQTSEVQDEIHQFLQALQARRARLIQIEVAVVPAASLDQAKIGLSAGFHKYL